MRDPYLYDDVNVLKNLADIKDSELLRKAEADITGLSMAAIYDYKYDKFNTETLQDMGLTDIDTIQVSIAKLGSNNTFKQQPAPWIITAKTRNNG